MLGRTMILAAVIAAALAVTPTARGDWVSIPVPNHDFELGAGTNPQTETGWYNDSVFNPGGLGGSDSDHFLTGWDLTPPPYRFAGRWNPTDSNYVGCTDGDATPDPVLMDGAQVAFLHWGSGVTTGSNGIIRSTNAITTIVKGKYVLTVAVGSPLGPNMDPVHYVRTKILANGVEVAYKQAPPPIKGVWTDFVTPIFDNSAGTYDGQELKIELFARCVNMERRHVDFDNVRLEFIPEHATLAFLGASAALLLKRRRRPTQSRGA